MNSYSIKGEVSGIWRKHSSKQNGKLQLKLMNIHNVTVAEL